MQKKIIHFTIVIFIFSFWGCQQQNENTEIKSKLHLFESCLKYAEGQLERTVREVDNFSRFPRSTQPDGKWKLVNAKNWCAAFFPGSLWYMYEWTGDLKWREWAEKWTANLESNKFRTDTHDVGFLIYCTFGNGYRLTGNEHYRDVLIQAAQSLAQRYNPTVGAIKSFDWRPEKFPMAIDVMMNLELLFWAAKNGGGQELYDIAVRHAETNMREIIREDGGTYHMIYFDDKTGEIERKDTFQGYGPETTWARGHTWAIYGFSFCYRETGDKRFLNTAIRLADYYLKNLPEDHVPYWDFQAPASQKEKESSAAAIAASALLQLSDLVEETNLKKEYQKAVFDMLSSLCSEKYLSKGTENSSILLHSVGHRPKTRE